MGIVAGSLTFNLAYSSLMARNEFFRGFLCKLLNNGKIMAGGWCSATVVHNRVMNNKRDLYTRHQ
jgi:hypothetical protein